MFYCNERKKELNFLKWTSFISFVISFGIIMQSGGGIFRTFSLVLCIFLLIFILFFKKVMISRTVILCFLYTVASITISAVIAAYQGIDFISMITFNFSIYFFMIFYILARYGCIDISGYILACDVLSFVVIFLTICGYFGLKNIEFIKQKLIFFFNGLYGPKPFGRIVLWMAYFQGTLALIPACVFCLYMKKYFSFFICFFGIFFSGSRFGFLVVVLFYCFFNYNKFLKIISVLVIFFLILYLTESPMILGLLSMVNDNDGGLSIRFGHLQGIMEVFDTQPLYLLFGQGPGSFFYSYGFKSNINSCEISHFDFLRKYGLLYTLICFSMLLVFSYLLLKNTDKKGKGLGWAILSHFVVSISNPVLTSLPFMCFLSISIAYYCAYMREKGLKCKKESVQ